MESEAAKGKSNEVEDGEAVETKSPAVQTMEGYDPKRIPASVFSPSQGGDWSSASNESLFSIQMGNNSFSQDYAILYGTASFKSTELPRLDQWDNNRPSSFAASPQQTTYQAPPAKPTNPALRPSNASAQSNASFAFPVLVSDVKTDYSVRPMEEKANPPERAAEKAQAAEPHPQSPAPQKPQTQHQVGADMPKRWFCCFSCCRPRFCC